MIPCPEWRVASLSPANSIAQSSHLSWEQRQHAEEGRNGEFLNPPVNGGSTGTNR